MRKPSAPSPRPSRARAAAPPVTNSAPATPDWLVPHGDEVHLALRVQPRASRNAVRGPSGAELRVQVTAPPVDAAANRALLRFLAEILDCPLGALRIVRGHACRQKTIAVENLSQKHIRQRLSPTTSEPPEPRL